MEAFSHVKLKSLAQKQPLIINIQFFKKYRNNMAPYWEFAKKNRRWDEFCQTSVYPNVQQTFNASLAVQGPDGFWSWYLPVDTTCVDPEKHSFGISLLDVKTMLKHVLNMRTSLAPIFLFSRWESPRLVRRDNMSGHLKGCSGCYMLLPRAGMIHCLNMVDLICWYIWASYPFWSPWKNLLLCKHCARGTRVKRG